MLSCLLVSAVDPDLCIHAVQISPLVCRVWFFLAFKEQILGLINASTAAQAPDEVLPSTTLYHIPNTGSGSVDGNCDDT